MDLPPSTVANDNNNNNSYAIYQPINNMSTLSVSLYETSFHKDNCSGIYIRKRIKSITIKYKVKEVSFSGTPLKKCKC